MVLEDSVASSGAGTSQEQQNPAKTRRPKPKVSLEQLQIEQPMSDMDHQNQLVFLDMMLSRMLDDDTDNKIGEVLTEEQLEELSTDCNVMAHAWIESVIAVRSTAGTKDPLVPSLPFPYSGGIRTAPASTLGWGNVEDLTDLNITAASSARVPDSYITALRHKVYLPLSMFTHEHLMKEAANVEQEKHTLPSLAKVMIPKVKQFMESELLLAKADWDGAYEYLIPAIKVAGGESFAEMFRDWHLCCKSTEQYQDNDSFHIIRQFDTDMRRRFFAHNGSFRLGSYLINGANGITRFAANYALKRQIEQAQQLASSIATLQKETEAGFAALARGYAPSSIGPDRGAKRVNTIRQINTPFHASNRPIAASPGCCTRCGRKSHRARDCTETTLATSKDPIVCDFNNGRLHTRVGNHERCFRFNSGVGCNRTAHPTKGKHKCSLCGNDDHAAVNCGRAE